MILDRYLSARVLLRLLLVAFVFTAVFAAYTLAVYLARAAAGFLAPEFVASIILMKVLIAMEVILPIALYVAVVLTMGRLRASEEATALLACGYGPRDSGLGLAPLFAVVAVLVAVVSLWGRPLTYVNLYQLRARAEAAFDVAKLEPGRFYSDADGRRVVFAESGDEKSMDRVFIWIRRGDRDRVILADGLARADTGQATANLEMEGLRVYERSRDEWEFKGSSGPSSTSIDFGGLAPIGYKRKAATTQGLWGSSHPEDVAELQWRLSRPLSALLMGFLALRVAGIHRRARNGLRSVILVVSVCVLYNLISLTARSWVVDGVVGFIPGMWWVDGSLLLLLAAPLLRPARFLGSTPRDKARLES